MKLLFLWIGLAALVGGLGACASPSPNRVSANEPPPHAFLSNGISGRASGYALGEGMNRSSEDLD